MRCSASHWMTGPTSLSTRRRTRSGYFAAKTPETQPPSDSPEIEARFLNLKSQAHEALALLPVAQRYIFTYEHDDLLVRGTIVV